MQPTIQCVYFLAYFDSKVQFKAEITFLNVYGNQNLSEKSSNIYKLCGELSLLVQPKIRYVLSISAIHNSICAFSLF